MWIQEAPPKQLLIGQEMYTRSKLSQSGSVSVFISWYREENERLGARERPTYNSDLGLGATLLLRSLWWARAVITFRAWVNEREHSWCKEKPSCLMRLLLIKMLTWYCAHYNVVLNVEDRFRTTLGLWISEFIQNFWVELEPNWNSSIVKYPGPTSNVFNPISLELSDVINYLHMIRAGSSDLWSHRYHWTSELPRNLSPILQTVLGGYCHWINQKAAWLYLFGTNNEDCWLLVIMCLSFCPR